MFQKSSLLGTPPYSPWFPLYFPTLSIQYFTVYFLFHNHFPTFSPRNFKNTGKPFLEDRPYVGIFNTIMIDVNYILTFISLTWPKILFFCSSEKPKKLFTTIFRCHMNFCSLEKLKITISLPRDFYKINSREKLEVDLQNFYTISHCTDTIFNSVLHSVYYLFHNNYLSQLRFVSFHPYKKCKQYSSFKT